MLYDLIIIGGGPAGITAGIYASRQKLNTLLIAKTLGGQLTRKAVDIENYPGFEKIPALELIKKLIGHLKKQKIKIEFGEVDKIEKEDNFTVFMAEGDSFQAKAVIVASGADPRPLEIPGEKEFLGKGVSYCTICDGAVFHNKTVAIIGGGNAGFESAIFLSKIAKKIYILEFLPRVAADVTNQEVVKKGGKTEVITNARVEKIEGDHFVKSLTYQDRETNKEITIAVDGVFIEIGNQPATSFAKGLVDFNERDEIKVEFETYQTKTPGLFAAGDCNVGQYKQIITACGEGAKAALSAFRYVQGQKSH